MARWSGWFRGLFGREVETGSGASLQPGGTLPGGKRLAVPGSFAEENNDFACALFGELRQRQGNLFLSPFSIRAALGMALAGARGETATQIARALRASASDETLHAALGAVIRRLNEAGGGEYEMAVANALWVQAGLMLEVEFRDLMARHYAGGLNPVDFRRAAEAARATINRWVEERTGRKIRDLIPAGGLDALTRLVLVNAVYFKGLWDQQFTGALTRDEVFHLEAGGTVRAPLMHGFREIPHLKADGYRAVDLDYRGRDLSMLVLLPDRIDGLGDLEKALSARMLHDCVAWLDLRYVKLFLPRFKITWGTVDLTGSLAAPGMTLPFDVSKADFSGITGHRPPDEEAVYLSAVFHKAFVEVNEKGTEAAAATAVQMTTAMRPIKPSSTPVFRADHPFLFAIRERRSNVILFIGRVADPTREH